MSEEKKVDEELLKALRFLDGKIGQRDNRIIYSVAFEPDEEQAARLAISKCLLRPHPPEVLLGRLAGMFLTNSSSSADDTPRRLDISWRRRGNRSNPFDDAYIVAQVHVMTQYHKMSIEAAAQEFAYARGVSDETIMAALKRSRHMRDNLRHKRRKQ